MDLLKFVGIEQHTHNYARNLPYGHQRRLEIARALASDPRLLLLDEPAAGATPQEKVELMALVEKVRAEGVTVLLIEHDMKVVMGSLTASSFWTMARRSPRASRRTSAVTPG